MGLKEFKALKTKKRSKYGNKKVKTTDGVFDSLKEKARYDQLLWMQKVNEITKIRRQVRFPLKVNDQDCGTYMADFTYWKNGIMIVEDVKSAITRKISTYILKKKLMKAVYDIKIQEV